LLHTVASLRPVVDELMAAPFLPGREFTVGVIGARALPVVEIQLTTPLFEYDAKARLGPDRCHCPADIPPRLEAELRDRAVRACLALGLDGRAYGRVDFRCDDASEPMCLEVNACPGMRPASPLALGAVAGGWTYPELVDRIMNFAAPACGSDHRRSRPSEPKIPRRHRLGLGRVLEGTFAASRIRRGRAIRGQFGPGLRPERVPGPFAGRVGDVRSGAAHLLEAPGAHVLPVLLDEGQARVAVGLGQRGVPAGRDVDVRGPQRVLALVVDQDQERALRVLKGIGHGMTPSLW
jgi:hypothetical protein